MYRLNQELRVIEEIVLAPYRFAVGARCLAKADDASIVEFFLSPGVFLTIKLGTTALRAKVEPVEKVCVQCGPECAAMAPMMPPPGSADARTDPNDWGRRGLDWG